MRKAGVPQREYRKVSDSERTVHLVSDSERTVHCTPREERHALRCTDVLVSEGDSNI